MKRLQVVEVVERDLKSEKPKAIRRKGLIPGEVYGPGLKENLHISISYTDFERLLEKVGEATPINLKVKLRDGSEKTVMVFLKTFQRDKVSDRYIHVDFYAPSEDHKMTVHVPIEFKGTPVGLSRGGMLEVLHYDIPIEALPKDVMEKIELDISNMDVWDTIKAKDLKLPEGVKVLLDPEETIVSIMAVGARPEVEEVTTEEVEASEVEVIKKGKEEEEEEE